MQKSGDIAILAIQKDPHVFQRYAYQHVADNKQVALTAIHISAGNFECVGEALKSDPTFLLAAVKRNLGVVPFFPERAFEDMEIASQSMPYYLNKVHKDTEYIEKIPTVIRYNPDFIDAVCSQNIGFNDYYLEDSHPKWVREHVQKRISESGPASTTGGHQQDPSSDPRKEPGFFDTLD